MTPLVSTNLWPSVAFNPKGLVVCVISVERSFCDAVTKQRSRWEGHFVELSDGELCQGVPKAQCVFARRSARSRGEKRWQAEITDTWHIQRHLAAVSRGHAARPDGTPIGLIVASDLPAFEKVSQVFDCLIEHVRAPAQWR